jgi:hypothetical protein
MWVEAKIGLFSERFRFTAFVCGSQVPAKASIDTSQWWSGSGRSVTDTTCRTYVVPIRCSETIDTSTRAALATCGSDVALSQSRRAVAMTTRRSTVSITT